MWCRGPDKRGESYFTKNSTTGYTKTDQILSLQTSHRLQDSLPDVETVNNVCIDLVSWMKTSPVLVGTPYATKYNHKRRKDLYKRFLTTMPYVIVWNDFRYIERKRTAFSLDPQTTVMIGFTRETSCLIVWCSSTMVSESQILPTWETDGSNMGGEVLLTYVRTCGTI